MMVMFCPHRAHRHSRHGQSTPLRCSRSLRAAPQLKIVFYTWWWCRERVKEFERERSAAMERVARDAERLAAAEELLVDSFRAELACLLSRGRTRRRAYGVRARAVFSRSRLTCGCRTYCLRAYCVREPGGSG